MFEMTNFLLTAFALGLTTVFLAIYWYVSTVRYRYWIEHGVNGPKPNLFCLGNMITRVRNPPAKLEMDWQQKYGKVYGYYSGVEPVLTVNDPELIKQIMVKDFSMFVNRRSFAVDHPIWDSTLFVMDDQDWKRVRSITSPTFSTGKLHAMLPLMNLSVENYLNYLDHLIVAQKTDHVVIDPRDSITGFALDTIASTSFGTKTNSNQIGTNKSDSNPIIANALKFNQTNPLQMLAFFAFPKSVNSLLGIRHFFNPASFDYFVRLMKQVIGQRRLNLNHGRRNDFVQLLLDANIDENVFNKTEFEQLSASGDEQDKLEKKSRSASLESPLKTKLKLSDDEIISQGLIFFIGGFEGTSATIRFCLYELCVNPDIQQRLFDEVDAAFQEIDPDITDDNERAQIYGRLTSNELPYLDAVVKESLRKYPPGVRVERRVGVDGYRLANVELSKGQVIEFSPYAVHHNPEYYPNPELFDPERFMPENRHKLVPYSYVPFGVGPRNCIGMRYVYQVINLLLARLVHRFRFSATKDTPIPIQFINNIQILNVKPFQIQISKR